MPTPCAPTLPESECSKVYTAVLTKPGLKGQRLLTGTSAAILVTNDDYGQLIDKRVLELMADADVGPQWVAISKAPPLFGLDADGEPVFVEGGILFSKAHQKQLAEEPQC